PLKVTVNPDYTRFINYWKGTATNPGVEAAFQAVLQFALNHRLENCTFQKDVVDAMIRQPFTTETIPYKIYKTNEPIFAVDYNLGRNGFAYFDNDTADYHLNTNVYTNWNQGWSYRNDGVDIEPCKDSDANNGFNVGWTGNREWMEYTVDVDSTAAYTLSIRSASASGGSKVRLETEGSSISQVISLPGTSGWGNWRTTEVSGIILEKGTRKIRFIFDQGGSNLNYFKFSKPVHSDSADFIYLYSETSTDGETISLHLSKPVTTSNNELNQTDFILTINNIPVVVNSVLVTENQKILLLRVAEKLFYGGTIRLTYNGSSVFSNNQVLKSFSNVTVANKLPVRYNLPGRIQSENFSFNNGMVSETCTDVGGGFNMGYANPGDYLDYLVYIPTAGNYKFNFRVASERSSSQIIIRAGEGNSFTAVDTVTITGTGGWQTWKTISSTAFLPEGRYTLRIYVRSGEFNTNWFEAAKAPVTGLKTERNTGFRMYPNPAGNAVTIETDGIWFGEKIISFYNSVGQNVKTGKYFESKPIEIDISDLSKGLYFIEIRTLNGFSRTAKLTVW
ncbi:MAG: carbohydrate-binding protein, partial [Bacteroidetes bacterium]